MPEAEPQPRARTLWVLEDEPPADRQRWYCHLDGDAAPGFDTPEDAVEWGLMHAEGVVVRTLGSVFYLVGERPQHWSDDKEARGWPPALAEREQLDVDYGVGGGPFTSATSSILTSGTGGSGSRSCLTIRRSAVHEQTRASARSARWPTWSAQWHDDPLTIRGLPPCRTLSSGS